MGKKKKAAVKAEVVRREPLTSHTKELMMMIIIRNPEAYDLVREYLQPAHFGDADAAFRVIWDVVRKYAETYGQLPTLEFVQADVSTQLQENPGLLVVEDHDYVEDFLLRTFDEATYTEALDRPDAVKWAVQQAKFYLEEALVRQVVGGIQSPTGRVIHDMPAMLANVLSSSQQIQMLDQQSLDTLFPDGWDLDGGLDLKSSGLSFLDNFLNGGVAPGEVYGILGPYGSCKTTLTVMLAVQAARRARDVRANYVGDGPPPFGLSYIFSYEARKKELQIRTLSFAASIHRHSLEKMPKGEGLKSLSTAEHLKDYEKKVFAHKLKNGGQVFGEQERINSVIPFLNDHLRVIDMTGFDENRRGVGAGGVDEVARIIGADMRQYKSMGYAPYVESVIIDYAGALARRLMEAQEKDESALRHCLSSVVMQAKLKIGDQFSCHVFLMHQLSASANSRTSRQVMHHTDSAEAKNFAENLDFCMCICTPDKQNLCRMDCTKHRRAGPRPSEIIKIIGTRNFVKSVSDVYAIDPTSGAIRLRSEIEAAVDDKMLTMSKKAKAQKPKKLSPAELAEAGYSLDLSTNEEEVDVDSDFPTTDDEQYNTAEEAS